MKKSGLEEGLPDVVFQKKLAECVQCGVRRRNLNKNVRAVSVVLEHPADSLDLSLDSVEAVHKRLEFLRRALLCFS